MRLGLLGFPIEHSRSPELYRHFLGSLLTSYELFPFEKSHLVPELDYFREKLDGLNITSPYKTHFFQQVSLNNPIVKKLGSINTIGFTPDGIFGTNTDLLAVQKILIRFQSQYPKITLFLLGDGVMANLTKLVANDLGINLIQFSRRLNSDFESLDLSTYYQESMQPIVINACSRSFHFKGKLKGHEIFWDYNYDFAPHSSSLPAVVKDYLDGRELLELQAIAAIEFWEELTPKLK